MIAPVEIYTIDEPDRLLTEEEEYDLTNDSRTTRWRLTKEGRYPPKPPWLSEVLSFNADRENYRYNGELRVSYSPVPPPVKVRRIRRRAVRSR